MASALELAETALADVAGHGAGAWKQALLALEPMEPDAQAAAAVVAAYEAGRCPPWCAAALLGAIGHADGYATALAILRAAPGQLAESYAGPALVQMRGEAALADLAAVLEDDALPRRAHEGAAYGLAGSPTPARGRAAGRRRRSRNASGRASRGRSRAIAGSRTPC